VQDIVNICGLTVLRCPS